MKQSGHLSRSKKINLYLNMANLPPLVLLIVTGIIIQAGYHFSRLADETVLLGLNRYQWTFFHKTVAAISIAGIVAHCGRYRKAILIAIKKIMYKRVPSSGNVSWYLFAIWVPTCVTALTSWLWCAAGTHSRFMLVELHDKLALLFTLLCIMHVAARSRHMMKTYGLLKTSRAAPRHSPESPSTLENTPFQRQ